MTIKKIGVLGAGLMGAGIAQAAATSGYEVTLGEVSDELVQKGLSSIEKSLAKFAEKGTLTTEQKDAALIRGFDIAGMGVENGLDLSYWANVGQIQDVMVYRLNLW